MLNTIEVTGNKDTRSGFGDGILEAARINENVIALTADLAGSMKLGGFIKEFPERFIQCGIAYHWW
jgi:transketolase